MLEFIKKHRSVLLFAALFLCALLLYSNSLRQQNRTTLFEQGVLQLTSPLYRAITRCSDELTILWTDHINLVNVRQRNIKLLKELRKHRRQLLELTEIAQENSRLRQLLNFHQNTKILELPARVIAVDASSWFHTITIDKGSNDGITEGLAVVVAEGIVGRTIKCATNSSRVLLANDAASEIAALIQHNRTRCVARGKGTHLTLDYALRRKDVHLGDMVITAGTGGVFPKGLPIGTISNIIKHDYGLFQTLELAPSVNFSRLEDVLIILRERP
ncbi:MAG: rod shape-determining protein MreC [Thermodesulfobacteriota bacterium]|nr:rod shape-determining protein MreC [Thermodesulfobacteriota bacterium]